MVGKQDQLDEETANRQQAAQQLKQWNRNVEDEKRTQLKLDFEIDRLRNMILERDKLIEVRRWLLVLKR